MKYVKDLTGRFVKRPHYDPRELDDECEKVVTTFLKNKYGNVSFPFTTEDLKILIEQDVDDLDQYADLSNEGDDVEGVTEFFPKKKPKVRIQKKLSESASRSNRLRTTLAHEYGHVLFHNHVWQLDLTPAELSFNGRSEVSPKCKRENILGAGPKDWMEWQAGYVSGSILMPITHIRAIIRDYGHKKNVFLPVQNESPYAIEMINMVKDCFEVSFDAARVRISQLGHIVENDLGPTLF